LSEKTSYFVGYGHFYTSLGDLARLGPSWPIIKPKPTRMTKPVPKFILPNPTTVAAKLL
jgi:hypothetical protein